LNGTAHGVGIFTITANIGHIGLAEGDPRWNIEYLRWTAEQQLDQVRAVKAEILAFPRQPLRPTHVLFNKAHPLAEWAGLPTALPPVPAANQVQEADSDGEMSDWQGVSDDVTSDDSAGQYS
jgi:hypothetical protein